MNNISHREINIVHKMEIVTSLMLRSYLAPHETDRGERVRETQRERERGGERHRRGGEEKKRERERETTWLCVTDCVCMRQYVIAV